MGAVVSFSLAAFRRFAAVTGPVECIAVRLLLGFLTTTQPKLKVLQQGSFAISARR